jgi:hypothetical protein
LRCALPLELPIFLHYIFYRKSFELLGVLPVSDHARDIDRFRLDPSRFPKRIDILVRERVVDHIQAVSARTGRSFAESAAVILAQRAEKFDPEQFDA